MFDSKIVSRLSAAALTDAVGRKYSHRSHISDLKSPNPERILFGEAVTINFLPFREDRFDPEVNNFASLFYQSLENNYEGKVLVLGASGQVNASVGGGTKLSRLQNHNLAGVLAEGRLRDFDELSRYSFATYCSGETSRWGTDEVMPVTFNKPIKFYDVTICPGDYVYAKGSLAVVIPGNDIKEVIEEALKVEQEDRKYMRQIKSEKPGEVIRSGSDES